MHQFDSYIKLIVKDLNISKTQREEISDEFRDHLEMLKKDYLDQGNTEEAAVAMAIKKFGNNNLLRKKLSVSINNYRSIPNMLFGIAYLTFLLLGFKLLITLTKGHFIMEALSQFCSQTVILLSIVIVMLSPIGYFLPIIFKAIYKLKYIVGIYCLLDFLDIGYGSYLFYRHSILGGSTLFFITLSVIGFLAMMLSGVFGYKLLNLVNNKLFAA